MSSPRPRVMPTALVASLIVVVLLAGVSVAIWNLVDTRESVPPVQLAP